MGYLKIEGSFVRNILENPFNQAMVEAISNIGHTLSIGIIAEWAENDAIVACLKDMGIDYAQGYALDSPSPMGERAA